MAPQPEKKGSTKAAPAAAKSEGKKKAPAAAKAPEKPKAAAPAPAAAKKPAAAAPAPAAPKKAAPAAPAAPAAETKAKPAVAAPKAAKPVRPAKSATASKKKTTAPPKKATSLKGKSAVVGRKKKIANHFEIDCTLPAEDQLFNCADFEKFLRDKVKVSGKTSNFGGSLQIERGDKNKVAVKASIPFSKRYLKYLTKKYLKKNLLRDTLRVIANSKTGYELRYFQIGNDTEEEEDAE